MVSLFPPPTVDVTTDTSRTILLTHHWYGDGILDGFLPGDNRTVPQIFLQNIDRVENRELSEKDSRGILALELTDATGLYDLKIRLNSIPQFERYSRSINSEHRPADYPY